jgi:hypothetical protein
LKQRRRLQFLAVFHSSIAATRIAVLALHSETVTADLSFSQFLFCFHPACRSHYAGVSVDNLSAHL